MFLVMKRMSWAFGRRLRLSESTVLVACMLTCGLARRGASLSPAPDLTYRPLSARLAKRGTCFSCAPSPNFCPPDIFWPGARCAA